VVLAVLPFGVAAVLPRRHGYLAAVLGWRRFAGFARVLQGLTRIAAIGPLPRAIPTPVGAPARPKRNYTVEAEGSGATRVRRAGLA